MSGKGSLRHKVQQEGPTFIISLAIMVFLLPIALPVLFPSSVEKTHAQQSSTYSAALALAEAGLEKAVSEMNYGYVSSWKGDRDLRTITISSYRLPEGDAVGDIEIKIKNPDGEHPVVEAIGRIAFTASMKRGMKSRIVVERRARAVLERDDLGWACSSLQEPVTASPVTRASM